MRRSRNFQPYLSSLNSLLAKRNFRKYLKPTGLIISLLLLIVIARQLILPGSNDTSVNSSVSPQTLPVDSGFDIPINNEGESISFKITSVEITDQIILRGQKAHAKDGRIFLVLNLKLTNNLQKRVKIDTRDYVRLSSSDSTDRLAPQIHNDPVEVQPISDQFTRVGFSVSNSSKDFKLFVGEISADKTEIDLNFN